MSSSIEKRKTEGELISAERKAMNAALARLDQIEVRCEKTARSGRLLFGVDLTSSRQPSFNQAQRAMTAMFETIKTIGAIAVKLIYFRGMNECRESKWYDDPRILIESMRRLSCDAGITQIARLLSLALSEEGQVSGLVFVGDHCEDGADAVLTLAEKLGQRSMPIFVFHECADDDHASLLAKPIFKGMAEVSGGVYVEFKLNSSDVLRELLIGMGAFVTGGCEGLSQIPRPQTQEARQLQSRLLLLGPAGNSPIKKGK
jgi:hypothetical protein